MTEYAGNSNKEKEGKKQTDKNVKKVVIGEVIQKKKPVGQKFKDVFFGGDFKTAMKFVAAEVLVPALKSLLYESVAKGTERVVFGDRNYNRNSDYRSRIQYNNPMRQDPRTMARLPDQAPRALRAGVYEIQDVILSSREEAELVLENLMNIVDKYDVASVSDLNTLLGLPTSHVDLKWGWSFLGNANVTQIRQGYLLELPRLEEI